MKVHVLVEGPSELAFFDRWLPRAFARHEFVTHPHQGRVAFPGTQRSHRCLGVLASSIYAGTLRAYSHPRR